MSSQIKRNYEASSNKLRDNWEDVQQLIALHNEVLDRINILQKTVDRLWTTINSLNERIN